ncbi:hypothetical protein TNCV_3762621 [Trichonephila clavipes]|nr:hypothetical protein TNCV_3762621 [Trichonephila clavipes]
MDECIRHSSVVSTEVQAANRRETKSFCVVPISRYANSLRFLLRKRLRSGDRGSRRTEPSNSIQSLGYAISSQSHKETQKNAGASS